MCKTTLHRPIVDVDRGLIGWLLGELLTEARIERIMKEFRVCLAARAKTSDDRLPRLQRAIAKLDDELKRLGASLLYSCSAPSTIVSMIQAREERKKEILAEISEIQAKPNVVDLEARRWEAEARRRLLDARSMLAGAVQEARKVMTLVFPEPLIFRPTITGWGEGRWHVTGSAEISWIGGTNGGVPNEI